LYCGIFDAEASPKGGFVILMTNFDVKKNLSLLIAEEIKKFELDFRRQESFHGMF